MERTRTAGRPIAVGVILGLAALVVGRAGKATPFGRSGPASEPLECTAVHLARSRRARELRSGRVPSGRDVRAGGHARKRPACGRGSRPGRTCRDRLGPADQGAARGRPGSLSSVSARVRTARPDLTLARTGKGGDARPGRARRVGHTCDLPEADRAAIEAEPNDSWQEANELRLGRDVYGTADDVDYLENRSEGKAGLDWFRFEVKDEKPVLVYFQLDLLDRDVSANLRVYTVDPKTGRPVPYLNGKDPMEIVHDRERERYSKHISRTFTPRDVLPGGQRQPSGLHPAHPAFCPCRRTKSRRRRSRRGCTTS